MKRNRLSEKTKAIACFVALVVLGVALFYFGKYAQDKNMLLSAIGYIGGAIIMIDSPLYLYFNMKDARRLKQLKSA